MKDTVEVKQNQNGAETNHSMLVSQEVAPVVPKICYSNQEQVYTLPANAGFELVLYSIPQLPEAAALKVHFQIYGYCIKTQEHLEESNIYYLINLLVRVEHNTCQLS